MVDDVRDERNGGQERQESGIQNAIPDTRQPLFTTPDEDICSFEPPTTVPLAPGTPILNEHYCISKLLYQRPRLNLYLGRRVVHKLTQEEGELVAIRELVLDGLPAQVCAQIEAAAFEEFAAPVVLGSLRRATFGDRIHVERQRHYLVMQLSDSRQAQESKPVTLEEVLLGSHAWPLWLTDEVALNWGSQLCRIVSRLHNLGAMPGNLSPRTLIIDQTGNTSWSPLLLPSWPPAPQFWSVSFTDLPTPLLHCRIFPIVENVLEDVFIAPEMLFGMSDVRSDVYTLGAILYLLTTRYAPIAAARRVHLDYAIKGFNEYDGLALVQPSLLNTSMSPEMEQVVLQALALAPDERYQSVFELVEALESIGKTNGKHI